MKYFNNDKRAVYSHEVIANPNTLVRAIWYKITEEFFNEYLEANILLSKGEPIQNGNPNQKFDLDTGSTKWNGDTLYKQEEEDGFSYMLCTIEK